MNAGVASLIALLAAIVVGYISKKNIGIISIGFALLIAELYGISVKQLNSGFSTSLAMSMIGVTYLLVSSAAMEPWRRWRIAWSIWLAIADGCCIP